MSIIPVTKKPGFSMIQCGMTRAENMENPKIKIFLEEFISVDYKMRCFRKRGVTLLTYCDTVHLSDF